MLVSCDEWRTGRKAHKQGRWLPGMFLWLPGKFLAERCPHRKGSVAAGGSPPPPCARSNLSRPFSRALKRLFIYRQLNASQSVIISKEIRSLLCHVEDCWDGRDHGMVRDGEVRLGGALGAGAAGAGGCAWPRWPAAGPLVVFAFCMRMRMRVFVCGGKLLEMTPNTGCLITLC